MDGVNLSVSCLVETKGSESFDFAQDRPSFFINPSQSPPSGSLRACFTKEGRKTLKGSLLRC